MSYQKERKYAFIPSKSSLSSKTEYYVYVLCDPRKPGKYNYVLPNGKKAKFTNRPFYVGKGKGHRSKSHLQEALKNKPTGNTYKLRTIRKILREGFAVDIKVCKPRFDEATAYEYEKMLIEKIGRHDLKTGPLTNLTRGGDGAIGLSPKSAKKKAKRLSIIGKARYDALPDGYNKWWWDSLTEEHQKQFGDRKSEDTKAFFASLTEEEYAAHLEQANAKRMATFAAKTEEEKQATSAKQSASQTARHALRTEEERNAVAAKGQATIAKKSDKEKAKTTKRKSKSAKSWYNSLTEEQKAEMKRKQDAAKANYPLRTCPHCGHQGKGGNMTRYHFDNCKYK